MSEVEVAWVWQHSPYSGNALAIHVQLGAVANAGKDYELWWNWRHMAEKLRMNTASVRRILGSMVADGYLACLDGDDPDERRKRGARVRYRFLMPDVPVVWDGGAPPGGGGSRKVREGGRAKCARTSRKVRDQ